MSQNSLKQCLIFDLSTWVIILICFSFHWSSVPLRDVSKCLILFFFQLLFFLLVGATSSKKPKSPIVSIRVGMKFGNMHRLTESDLTSHFKDGGHDVISRRKVLPRVLVVLIFLYCGIFLNLMLYTVAVCYWYIKEIFFIWCLSETAW